MFFNSFNYAIFLPIIFVCYWFLSFKSYKIQNIQLLVASYVFYAFWDWRFLFLLMFSTFLDYFTGLQIHKSTATRNKRIWLTISVVTNLGFLCFFKYYNFFSQSFAEFISHFGLTAHASTLSLILPVGISFYTFHGLSYVFDIYNNKITPRTNIVDYSLFVSFFPLLVAGPIERATHLLPQVEKARPFDYAKVIDGLRQILWGLFKKMVIADNCAEIANKIFDHSAPYNGSALALGAVFFAFQIYGDFSGYSDIALGTARLLGFELLRNFAFPYFSRDIAEFWRRWHISLSSWFRDYLYFPLGGSRGNKWNQIRNTFIIFLVSGFWHGANWTFLAWGAFHATCFLPLLLLSKNRNNLEIVAKGKKIPSLKELVNMLFTFGLVVIAWVFFRSKTVGEAFHYIRGMLSRTLFQIPDLRIPWYLIITVVFFILVEWNGREETFAIAKIGLKCPRILRWSFYYLIVFMIFYCTGSQQQFIYFQF
jgi:alginate O-acetyltransferase complex protein AlgI